MNKTQAVLYLYYYLQQGKSIYLDEVMNDFNISLSTFRRYISELNIFLCETYQNKVLYYDYSSYSYYLKEI